MGIIMFGLRKSSSTGRNLNYTVCGTDISKQKKSGLFSIKVLNLKRQVKFHCEIKWRHCVVGPGGIKSIR